MDCLTLAAHHGQKALVCVVVVRAAAQIQLAMGGQWLGQPNAAEKAAILSLDLLVPFLPKDDDNQKLQPTFFFFSRRPFHLAKQSQLRTNQWYSAMLPLNPAPPQ